MKIENTFISLGIVMPFIVVLWVGLTVCAKEKEEVKMGSASYKYNARVIRWVDGDTVDLDVDLGFRVHIQERFRLLNVDTPERGELDFDVATKLAQTYAPEGSMVIIESKSTGKYGRWLAMIWSQQAVDDGLPSVNQILMERGWKYERESSE